MYATFPFLSALATNYEEYQFLGLSFMYKSTSGVAVSGTNPSLGTVIFSTQYDAKDAPFTTKQQMDSYVSTTSTVPNRDMLHPVECDYKQNVMRNLYVRNAPPPLDTDLRLYDLGKFSYATAGMLADGDTVGELWVTYHVRFLKPKLVEEMPLFARLLSTDGGSPATWMRPGLPLGDSILSAQSGQSPGFTSIAMDVGASTTLFNINFPGKYQIQYSFSIPNGAADTLQIQPGVFNLATDFNPPTAVNTTNCGIYTNNLFQFLSSNWTGLIVAGYQQTSNYTITINVVAPVVVNISNLMLAQSGAGTSIRRASLLVTSLSNNLLPATGYP